MNVPAAAVVPPIAVPLILPPVIAADDDPKLFDVTSPVPKVTGLFVVVSIFNVPVVASNTGLF